MDFSGIRFRIRPFNEVASSNRRFCAACPSYNARDLLERPCEKTAFRPSAHSCF
jgi:hypothetical protein